MGLGWVVLDPSTASDSISLCVCIGPKESCEASGLKVSFRFLYVHPHMESLAGLALGVARQVPIVAHGHRCLREGDSQSERPGLTQAIGITSGMLQMRE